MKGATKFWLAVFFALLLRGATYVYMHSDNEALIINVKVGLFGYIILSSWMLLCTYCAGEWNERKVFGYCYLAPLFWIAALIYFINKLANKYL